MTPVPLISRQQSEDECDALRRIEAFARPPGPTYSITDFYGGDDPVHCAHCGWDPSR
jgi:hypothetical protein